LDSQTILVFPRRMSRYVMISDNSDVMSLFIIIFMVTTPKFPEEIVF